MHFVYYPRSCTSYSGWRQINSTICGWKPSRPVLCFTRYVRYSSRVLIGAVTQITSVQSVEYSDHWNYDFVGHVTYGHILYSLYHKMCVSLSYNWLHVQRKLQYWSLKLHLMELYYCVTVNKSLWQSELKVLHLATYIDKLVIRVSTGSWN